MKRGLPLWALPVAALALVLGACTPSPTPMAATPVATPISATATLARTFASAQEAATYGARRLALARGLVFTSVDACPALESCLAFRNEATGADAAYFRYLALSSTDNYACLVYVIHTSAGWHVLNTSCGLVPERGSIQAVTAPNGCANVQDAPGVGGKVVACLADQSAVEIDAGPVFAPQAGAVPGHLWWHLKGKGWMAHDYLAPNFAPGMIA